LDTAPLLPSRQVVRLTREFQICEAGPVVIESPAIAFPRRILRNQEPLDAMQRNMETVRRQLESLRPNEQGTPKFPHGLTAERLALLRAQWETLADAELD